MQARKYCNGEYSVNWTKDLLSLQNSDEALANCLSDSHVSQSTTDLRCDEPMKRSSLWSESDLCGRLN